MAWNQLTFFTSRALADKLSNLLHDFGAVAVTLKEGGTEEILEPLPGETPLWSETLVTGLFEQDQDVECIIQMIMHHLDEQVFPEYKIEEIVDQDWERVWLKDFKPMQFGEGIWVIPSAFEAMDDSAINVFLDPGLAFGTGTHPTTALCLQWLDGQSLKNQTVIDYGCGSGILAIVAAKLGAEEVFAFDIDPQAVAATKQNALNNGVEARVNAQLVSEFQVKAADLLLANILANPLMELAKSFSDMLKPGANLVISGILQEQADEVLNSYMAWFDMNPPKTQDQWVMLSGCRRGTKALN